MCFVLRCDGAAVFHRRHFVTGAVDIGIGFGFGLAFRRGFGEGIRIVFGAAGEGASEAGAESHGGSRGWRGFGRSQEGPDGRLGGAFFFF